MFGAKTKTVLRCLGAEKDLMYNENLNFQVKMFSLVMVQKKKSWLVTKYGFIDLTLFDLMAESIPEDLSALTCKGCLLEDISTSNSFAGSVTGSATISPGASSGMTLANVADATVEAQAAGSRESSTNAFNVGYEEVNLRELRKRFENRKVHGPKKMRSSQKLAFVYKIISNSTPVTIFSKASGSGSVSAKQKQAGNMSAQGSGTETMSFTVPAGSTLAFGLMEVDVSGGRLNLPLIAKEMRRQDPGPNRFGKLKKKDLQLNKMVTKLMFDNHENEESIDEEEQLDQ